MPSQVKKQVEGKKRGGGETLKEVRGRMGGHGINQCCEVLFHNPRCVVTVRANPFTDP